MMFLQCLYESSAIHDSATRVAPQHNCRVVVVYSWWIGWIVIMLVDTLIHLERPQMTINIPTVRSWFRYCRATIRAAPIIQQDSTDKFKRFKLVLALLWRFPNHQDSSQITTVLQYYYHSRRCLHHIDKSGWIVAQPLRKSWMCY